MKRKTCLKKAIGKTFKGKIIDAKVLRIVDEPRQIIELQIGNKKIQANFGCENGKNLFDVTDELIVRFVKFKNGRLVIEKVKLPIYVFWVDGDCATLYKLMRGDTTAIDSEILWENCGE